MKLLKLLNIIFFLILFSSFTYALDYSTNMSSYYNCSDTSVMRDSLGKNNGTINDMGSTAGILGNGYDFDGVNDWVDFDSKILANLGEYTFSAWLWSDDLRGNVMAHGFEEIKIVFATDNTILFNPTSTQDAFIKYSATGLNGGWSYYTFVYNGSGASNTDKAKIYINATLVTPSTTAGTIPSSTGNPSQNTHFGYRTSALRRPYNGKMDEVALFNKALTPEEIEGIYNDGDGCNVYNNPTGCGGTPPISINLSATYYSPTPENNNFSINNNPQFNITINSSVEIDVINWEWNGTNETLSISDFLNLSNNKYNIIINKTSLSDGYYTYNFHVNNTDGNYTSAGLRNLTIDTTYPFLTWTNPANDNSTILRNNITLDITANDINLYQCAWQISNSSGVIYSNETEVFEGSTTSYNIQDFFDLSSYGSQYMNVSVSCSDGHTDNDWTLKNEIILNKNINKSEYNLKINNEDEIKIKYSNVVPCDRDNKLVKTPELIKFDTKQFKDRIVFVGEYDSCVYSRDKYIYFNEKVDVIKNSKYKGHIVIDGKYWEDSEPYQSEIINIEKNYIVIREYLNSNKYESNSFGGINVVNETRRFYLDNNICYQLDNCTIDCSEVTESDLNYNYKNLTISFINSGNFYLNHNFSFQRYNIEHGCNIYISRGNGIK